MISTDNYYRASSITGSFIMTICFFPQLIKVYKTKSAKDISQKWIYLSIFALCFVVPYAIHFELWEILVPVLCRQVLLIILITMKKYYDKQQKQNSQNEIV